MHRVKTKIKRAISVVLVMVLILGTLPSAAFAVQKSEPELYVTSALAPNGNGTKGSPFNHMTRALEALERAGSGGTIHLVDSEVKMPDGSIIHADGGGSFVFTDTESEARTLPKGDITVIGEGNNRLNFHGSVILQGNLTVRDAEVYMVGSQKAGHDRRIYCNGYDLTIDNCTIGNYSTATTTDHRGMVILTGGYKKNVTVQGTQNIRINSGRIDAIYAGGERSKVTGNVNIEITAASDNNNLELAQSATFGLAGIYAQGVDSKSVSNPVLDSGTQLNGDISVSLSGRMREFEKYVGNGNPNSTFKMADSGIGWSEPNFKDFPKIELSNAEIIANLTGVTDITLRNNTVLKSKTAEKISLNSLNSVDSTLQLKARQQVEIASAFEGNAALKIEGTPAAPNETVTYLTAPINSSGTLTLSGKEILPEANGDKKLWQVTGETPSVTHVTLEITQNRTEVQSVVLPEGHLPYTDLSESGRPYVHMDVKAMNGSEFATNVENYYVDVADDAYAQRLTTQQGSEAKYFFTLRQRDINELIPAGEMTVIGGVEVGGTVYEAEKILRMVVEPSIDFYIERKAKGDYLVPTLKGAMNFDGTIVIAGKNIPITSGDSVELAAGAATGSVTAKFTPTDADHYKTAEKTRNVDLSPKITFKQITESGKTLAAAELTADKGTVQWIGQDGKELPASTPILWGETYRWKCIPSAYAAPIYGNIVLGEGDAPVEKKTPAGTPTFAKITAAGKTLADAPLTGVFK